MEDRKVNAVKKKKGAVLSAVTIILFMAIYVGVFAWLIATDSAHLWLILVLAISPVAVIIGVVIALRERIKEIEGGEEDDALNY